MKFQKLRITESLKPYDVMKKFQIIDDLLADLPIYKGSGSPETVVSAPVGSLYLRIDGGPGTTLYVKESGSDTIGWTAK